MIINLLINLVLLIFGAIFVFLPEVTIASIPFIGEQLSSILQTVALTWNAFMVTFPYAQTGWQIFLTVVLPFEVLMLIAKFFFGHRLPAHTN